MDTTKSIALRKWADGSEVRQLWATTNDEGQDVKGFVRCFDKVNCVELDNSYVYDADDGEEFETLWALGKSFMEANALRIARAGDVICYYGRLPGSDKENAFGDLLADLRHFAAENGFDWDYEIRHAQEHYEAEIGGEL